MFFLKVWTFLVLLATATCLHAVSSLALAPSTGPSAELLEVPLRLAGDDRLAAMQVDITFDPAVFSFSSVVVGDQALTHQVEFNEVQPGRVRVVVTSMENAILAVGDLFRITGALLSESESNALSISSIILADESGLRVGYAFAPFVSLLDPSNNGFLPTGEAVEIQAVAFSNGSSIDEVEIFVNGQSLGSFGEGPFVVSWTPLEAGQALLTAIVRSSGGVESTADAVNLIIEGTAIDGVDAWLNDNFTEEQRMNPLISGLFVDPDGDRLLNIFEYATGTLPLAFTPEVDLPQTRLIYINDTVYIALRYRLRANVTDIVATVQTSASPAFPEGSISEGVLIEQLLFGDYFLTTERDPVPLPNAVEEGGRYIRLLIEEAPPPAIP